MKFQSLLIVTYGRTGSTLLQGLCNALPGCVVRGENYNFCYPLFGAWSQLNRAKEEFGKGQNLGPENPWFGAQFLSPTEFLSSLRPVLERQLVGAGHQLRPACLGFKEIRYLPENLGCSLEEYPKRLHEYLGFLADLMPQPAIIFLTRDVDQVARSAWWRDRNPAVVRKLLKAFESTVKDFRHPDCPSFMLDYADLLANGDAIGRLFDFLGVPRDPALVAEVLSREHSFPGDRGGSSGAKPHVLPAAKPGKYLPDFALVSPLPTGVALVAPDPPSAVAGKPDQYHWNGVVVSETSPVGLSLALQTPQGELPVEWGRKSPWALQQRPQLAWAATSRYKGPAIMLKPGDTCTLVLRQGELKVPLATLVRGPGAGASTPGK